MTDDLDIIRMGPAFSNRQGTNISRLSPYTIVHTEISLFVN